MTKQERFAAMFAAIDDDGRRFILYMLEGEYERVQKERRPVLRLIQGGRRAAPPRNARGAPTNEPVSACAGFSRFPLGGYSTASLVSTSTSCFATLVRLAPAPAQLNCSGCA